MSIWVCSVLYAEHTYVDLSLQCTLYWSQACWSWSAVYFMLYLGMSIWVCSVLYAELRHDDLQNKVLFYVCKKKKKKKVYVHHFILMPFLIVTCFRWWRTEDEGLRCHHGVVHISDWHDCPPALLSHTLWPAASWTLSFTSSSPAYDKLCNWISHDHVNWRTNRMTSYTSSLSSVLPPLHTCQLKP